MFKETKTEEGYDVPREVAKRKRRNEQHKQPASDYIFQFVLVLPSFQKCVITEQSINSASKCRKLYVLRKFALFSLKKNYFA